MVQNNACVNPTVSGDELGIDRQQGSALKNCFDTLTVECMCCHHLLTDCLPCSLQSTSILQGLFPLSIVYSWARHYDLTDIPPHTHTQGNSETIVFIKRCSRCRTLLNTRHYPEPCDSNPRASSVLFVRWACHPLQSPSDIADQLWPLKNMSRTRTRHCMLNAKQFCKKCAREIPGSSTH